MSSPKKTYKVEWSIPELENPHLPASKSTEAVTFVEAFSVKEAKTLVKKRFKIFDRNIILAKKIQIT